MNIKERREIILENIDFSIIEEGLGATIGATAVVLTLASLTGLAYDKISKMTKEQMKKITNKENIIVNDKNDMVTIRTYKPPSTDVVISQKELESYGKLFETQKNNLIKIIKSEIPDCKINSKTLKVVDEYSDVIKCSYSVTLFNVEDNIKCIEKYAEKKGYDTSDEDEYFYEISACIEDEIMKKFKKFTSEGSGIYSIDDGIMLFFSGDDVDELELSIRMDLVIKK